MKWRWIWITVLAVTALTSVGFYLWFDSVRVRYQGRTVKAWLLEFQQTDQARHDAAREAFKRMGSSAVPYLQRVLQRRDSALKKFAARADWAIPWIDLRWMDAFQWCNLTFSAALALGTNATPLLPDLIRAYLEVPSHYHWDSAMLDRICSQVGPASAPPLMSALTTCTNESELVVLIRILADVAVQEEMPEDLFKSVLETVRSFLKVKPAGSGPTPSQSTLAAIGALAQFGSKATPALEDLMTGLEVSDGTTRVMTAFALGRIRTRPEIVVPALAARLTDEKFEARRQAALSLSQFGAEAAPAVPALAQALQDEKDSVVHAALMALDRIGAPAKPAVPAVIGALAHPLPLCRSAAATALTRIHAEPALAVPALIAALQDPEIDVRRNAASSLGRIGPEATPALEALTGLLVGNKESVTIAAIEALGRLGPSARPAVPQLYRTWQNNQSAYGVAVQAALARIEGTSPTPASSRTGQP